MLRMLDRHAVQELVRAEVPAHAIAKQVGVSVRTIRRIVREAAVDGGDDAAARAARRIGRPQVTPAVHARAAALLGMKRPRLSQLVKQYGLAVVSSEGS